MECKAVLPQSRNNDLDFAVDNSDEIALSKARESNGSELLKKKLISAVKDEDKDIVKSVIDEIFKTSNVILKSWNRSSQLKKQESKFEIWLEAVYLAIENNRKHSNEILKLLLDCDIILGREAETDDILCQVIREEKKADDRKLRLIEALLEAGKFNVNYRGEEGRTVLHWVKEEKLVSLLIRYSADVNKKDNEGRTPLMSNLSIGILELRTILEEAKHLVDLNARDCNGRTALMVAALHENRHDDAELLLNAGASVNLSDHLGFTALHYALHMINFGERLLEYVLIPRTCDELKKIKEILKVLFDAADSERSKEKLERYKTFKEGNEQRIKIVELLLRRPDIDVNALSIELFSPLDIAEGTILEIRSSIKDALKEKGAVLNIFRQTQSQSSEFQFDVRCRRILHRLVTNTAASYSPKEKVDGVDFLKEAMLTLLETFREQIVCGKDLQGRTALHLVAISFSIISMLDPTRQLHVQKITKSSLSEDYKINLTNKIVDQLLSIGLSINATDTYGRTPLHYADEALQKIFKSNGADEAIKDKDGNSAIDKTLRRNVNGCSTDVIRYERNIKNIEMEINYQNSGRTIHLNEELNPTRALSTEVIYALCHPLVNQINQEVIVLMNVIAKEIERLDPRFEIRPELVGSSNEGTKLDEPDEFDFCFVLTKISELCEVSQSPELPTGFVHLKRRPIKLNEARDFDTFFGRYEILDTESLNCQFTIILHNALVSIENQQRFDCNFEMLELPVRPFFRLNIVSNIILINPLNFTSVNRISIDIVPCIHVEDWWPDDAITNVSDELKKFGCNLVFDRPQKLYPWVPYSEHCARISFAKAESDVIKQSHAIAREAYMAGKSLIKNTVSLPQSKYVLKNCLLYCIEALTPTSEKASKLGLSLEEMKSKFHRIDRCLWLKCLMKCHLEFVSQDFCPCYFLPNFSSPIGKGYLKQYSLKWITSDDHTFLNIFTDAYELSSFTSNQFLGPDPLWERFDRNQMIANLCKIAYKLVESDCKCVRTFRTFFPY